MRTIIITLVFTGWIFHQNSISQTKRLEVIDVKAPCWKEDKLDAAHHAKTRGKSYLFQEAFYLRLSNNKVDEGYPTKITNGWKDLPTYWNSGIQAAVRCEAQKKTYFFKDREYFSIQNGYAVFDLPKKLPGEFNNLPSYFHSNIDAGTYISSTHQMYLFKGNQYVRLINNRVEAGYPKKLPGEFTQLPKSFCSDLDAVMYREGSVYFFKSGQFIKYTNHHIETGSLKSMMGN